MTTPVIPSRRMIRRGSTLAFASMAVLVLGLFLSEAAHAGESTSAEVEKLIRRGNELRSAGKDSQALPLFQKAYDTAPAPRTAAQLGLVEVQLGYRLEAEAHLSEALAAEGDLWIGKYRSVLEEQLRTVRAGIGEVAVVGSPVGAIVTINGRARGRLPLAPIRVPAGATKIEVTADGYTDASATVTVRGQSQERVMLNLAPAVASTRKAATIEGPGPQPAAESAPWSTGKRAGVGAIIGGGVMVLGGAALLLIDKNETCGAPAGAMCRNRNQTRIPGWGLIGAGATAIVVGGIVVYSSSSSEVAVGVSPSSLVLAGRF